jgi:ribosomal protein S21
MAINLEIKKNRNENNLSVLKRFTRQVKESGVLNRVRSIRYEQRTPSPFTKKKDKLTSIRRKEFIEEQIKLGKMSDNPRGRRRR